MKYKQGQRYAVQNGIKEDGSPIVEGVATLIRPASDLLENYWHVRFDDEPEHTYLRFVHEENKI